MNLRASSSFVTVWKVERFEKEESTSDDKPSNDRGTESDRVGYSGNERDATRSASPRAGMIVTNLLSGMRNMSQQSPTRRKSTRPSGKDADLACRAIAVASPQSPDTRLRSTLQQASCL